MTAFVELETPARSKPLPPAFRANMVTPTGVITFDTTIGENHEGKSTLTRFPVDDDSTVSEHVIHQPEAVTIDVIITDDPIGFDPAQGKFESVPGGDPQSRAKDAWDEFRRLRRSVIPVSVYTRWRSYEKHIITSESVQRSSGTGDMLSIRLTLEELRRASVETVEAPPEPEAKQSKPARNLGRQNKKPATQEQETGVFVGIANYAGALRGG